MSVKLEVTRLSEFAFADFARGEHSTFHNKSIVKTLNFDLI